MIGQDEGRHFIATEYIAGETLRQRSERCKLDQCEVVAIARQVASALDARTGRFYHTATSNLKT